MNLLKDVLLGGLSPCGTPRSRAVVLMYHSVSDSTDYFGNVLPTQFKRHMSYMARTGRPVISFAELMHRRRSGKPLGGAITITLDDGYRDNYEIAFPILKRYGFPATIFVTTDLIGVSDKRNMPRLTQEHLMEMQSSGLIDIEPHSKSHPHLSRLSEADARAEIVDSKEILERMLGKECSFFAYPYGDFNDAVKGIVRDAGFDSAVSVREGTMKQDDDLFALPRVSIDSSTTMAQFRGKLTRAVDVYERIKQSV